MAGSTYTFEVTIFLRFMRQCRRLFELNTGTRSLAVYDPVRLRAEVTSDK